MIAAPTSKLQAARIEKMDPAMRKELSTFYGFGKHLLKIPIHDHTEQRKIGEVRDGASHYYDIFENDLQRRVLDAADTHGSKVSIRTANGAGKTSTLIPVPVLAGMAFYPRMKVVITSGVERQVRGQIFPALRAHATKLQGWDFTDNTITAPNGSVCIGFSTNDGGRFEGWHGNTNRFYDLAQNDGPLMIIVDEAKSVEQSIFDAIDRCTYQFLMIMSSCGGSCGQFYKTQTSEARFYKTFQIPSSHCPHADHKKNLELIQKRGIQDPLVRSKIFAEFMGDEAGSVLRRAWVQACLDRPPQFHPGQRRIYCDFAAGGDENTIASSEGNKVRLEAAWREKDTMRACGQFIHHFNRLGITPTTVAEQVAADADGLGKPMLDRLAELGWHLKREHNGARASDPRAYKNLNAETWWEGAKRFELGQVILENADDVTIAQLTERQGWAASNGQLEIESKADMKARGLDSPDRADAILGSMRRQGAQKEMSIMGSSFQRDDGWAMRALADAEGHEMNYPAGAHA
jgi:phage terminase large subunit